MQRDVEERPILGGYQNPHGLQPGGLRRGVRRSRKGTGIGIAKTDDTGAGDGSPRGFTS